MITLNNINLSSIDLSGIDLRGIKLGLGGRGGSGDGFPQLPGDVTRWHFGGLTNEMMAAMDDPRLEDADGKGRFLSFKNFAWSGMSGVGGYVQNFNGFRNNTTVDKVRIDEQSSNSVKVTILTTGIGNAIFIIKNIYQFNKSYFIKISSEGYNEGDLSLSFYAPSTSTATTVKVPLNPNGITEIPAIKEDDFLAVYLNVGGKVGSITIEQLPLYPGFILGDGVDDFAVTEKELNFEDTYTVYTAFIPFQDDPIKNMIVCGKDYKKDFYINYSTQLVFYTANSTKSIPLHINQFTVLLCKRDKTTGVIKNLVTGESFQFSVSQLISNPGLYYLWRSATVFSYGKTAIAGQTICNGYFSTDEDDENILNWHKKQYPWLFPDQAWTVTGKTNEDKDRATIANITGNGNDLVLSNFGFAEGSGYNEEGEYAGYLVTDGVDDQIISSSFEMGKDFTIVGDWEFLPIDKLNYTSIHKGNNLVLYNNSTGVILHLNQLATGIHLDIKRLNAICSDGRVYDKNWNEIVVYTPEEGVISTAKLMIGGNNNDRFTPLIFKNLGIYNNQILSKDDCIKAYNYLQTLKAK